MSARMETEWVCDRCHEVKQPEFRALSRSDNETYICSQCGMVEAFMDFAGKELTMPSEWALEGGDR